jgi:hypothetical protein
VVLHDGGQSGFIVDRGNPARKLRVPDKSVTTNDLAILGSKVDERITAQQSSITIDRMKGLRTHAPLKLN